jgi:hypothetical protein
MTTTTRTNRLTVAQRVEAVRVLESFLEPDPIMKIALANSDESVKKRLAEGTLEMARMGDERLKNGDYYGFLRLFGHQKLLRGFLAIESALSDGQYWTLLANTWTSVEAIQPDRRTWSRLLNSKRPGREFMTGKADRAELLKLPEPFTIFRGCNHVLGVDGFSWTLDHACAVQFSDTANGPRRGKWATGDRMFVSGKCRKGDVIAYINESGRNEQEIIIDPRNVFARSVEVLTPPLLA